ncbi:MAG: hypothetical protein E1N59_1452 [Puniceicoccaceae bacterium 5H]|nr:MAG: hypothetical protein E1N59_1452 [Puniceicoccaceae bacterium 5H]
MLKKILILGLLAASSTLSAEVITGASIGYLSDAEGPYVAAQAGYRFGSGRPLTHVVAAEVGYYSDHWNGGDAKTVPMLMNYRLNYAQGTSGLSYYAGGGAGVSWVEERVYPLGYWGGGWTDDDYAFTWQGFLGVQYAMADNVDVRLGYRYLKVENVQLFNFGFEWDQEHIIEFGVDFSF